MVTLSYFKRNNFVGTTCNLFIFELKTKWSPLGSFVSLSHIEADTDVHISSVCILENKTDKTLSDSARSPPSEQREDRFVFQEHSTVAAINLSLTDARAL